MSFYDSFDVSPFTRRPYCADFTIGDIVLWPNGTEGRVAAIDRNEDELQDESGAWVPAYDVDIL